MSSEELMEFKEAYKRDLWVMCLYDEFMKAQGIIADLEKKHFEHECHCCGWDADTMGPVDNPWKEPKL